MSNDKVSKKIPDALIGLLETQIASLMIQSKVPGMSIAVVVGDDIIYAKGFGARNLEKNLPATPDTLYGIASCTKSYTALAIMQLAQEGKIDVNDPVSKYLNFKLGKKSNPITIHHLLTHTTGIPNLGVDQVLSLRAEGFKEYYIPMSSLDDIMTFINGASQEIAAEPGERFGYLNEGYTFLGLIIEKVSNMNYESYIREKILKPLKMYRSIFTKEDADKDPDVMVGHYVTIKDWKIEGVKTLPYPFDKYFYAAGGMLSSVMEQANYLRMYMNGGVFEGKRILNANLIEKMQKVYIETDLVASMISGLGKEGYGYGWLTIEDFFGHKMIVHSGRTDVSSALLSLIPDRKIGIAAACNSGQSGLIAPLAMLISTFLIGKDPLKDLKILEIEQSIAALTGIYETYKGINRLKVIKRGSMLYLVGDDEPFAFNQGMSIPLIPESVENLKFYYFSGIGGKTFVTFVKDSPNKFSLYISNNHFHKVKELSLSN